MPAPLDPGGTPPRRIAVVVKGYPRLSETFIARELLSLEQHGAELTIVSLRHPTDHTVHPTHRQIAARLFYLPEYLHQEMPRVLRGWRRARKAPGYRRARALWLADLRRDPSPNRVRRWGQALVLAAELDPRIPHLHAHFLHTPASVARYAAAITGRSWSVSSHAKDIWLTPDWEKREKLADCAWAVTCTAYGRADLDRLAPGKTALCYHGLDLDGLPPPPSRPCRRGNDPEAPLQLLSVGRAVPKKGFDVLLEALALLPDGLHWRWRHIGGGSDRAALRQRAEALGLAGRITWMGAQASAEVYQACREADLFVLPSRIAADGDRDGLPNVLLEAASQALCCLASDVAGVGEFLEDGVNGRLAPPGDPPALASAILALAADPATRHQLGQAALIKLRSGFNHKDSIGMICRRLGLAEMAVAQPGVLEPAQ